MVKIVSRRSLGLQLVYDIGVAADRLPRAFAEARDYAKNAGGHARFERQVGNAQRRQRSLLGGFDNDAVADGQRRADFPSQHERREVPWEHCADDADRLARNHAHHVRARGR